MDELEHTLPPPPTIDETVDAAARATSKQAHWTRQHENILADWADKAACYRWLYTDANQIFSRYNTWFTIPVIIMSTLTGTANFAQERVPLEYRALFSMVVGCVNIIAGIITTIQQFLKISELNESHRVAAISWDKLYRNIRVELAKHPDERIPIVNFIKIIKDEYDRLMETSPQIPQKSMALFQAKFVAPDVPIEKLNEAQRLFRSVQAPDVCSHIKPTRDSIYVPPANPLPTIPTKRKTEMVDVVVKTLETSQREKRVKEFIDSFRNEYDRDPTADEITDNLDEVDAEEHATKLVGGVMRGMLAGIRQRKSDVVEEADGVELQIVETKSMMEPSDDNV
jgi:hypothetical protein